MYFGRAKVWKGNIQQLNAEVSVISRVVVHPKQLFCLQHVITSKKCSKLQQNQSWKFSLNYPSMMVAFAVDLLAQKTSILNTKNSSKK